jgi:Fur family ferric uptake transcriptional regulator
MDAVTRPASADDSSAEEILAVLRDHGGRATPAKRMLITALLGSSGHRTAEDIAAVVRAQAPDVALTTIYRNLEELERVGLVDRTRTDHGPATYHLASAAHGHLVCEHCGTMTEVPGEMFADLAAAAYRRYGFTLEPRRFAALGRCAECAAAGTSPGS